MTASQLNSDNGGQKGGGPQSNAGVELILLKLAETLTHTHTHTCYQLVFILRVDP